MRPIDLILARLPGFRKNGNGWSARCPAHDDRQPSLSITTGTDGRVLLRCHAGCEAEAICRALGLRMADLYPKGDGKPALGPIVATYDYHDEAGQLLFQVVRYPGKRFRQRRPDGQDGWMWKLGNTPRVLYRLPEILAAEADDWIFIVEGEKDADRLASLGFVATTCPQGAGKWGKLSSDSALHKRRVVIIPDKDEPGRKHAGDVVRRLRQRVRQMRVLNLPGEAKDVSDWLNIHGTVEQLLHLVEAAPDETGPLRALERQTIFIDTEEHRVAAETIAALAADPELYQRGGILVRVIRDRQPTDGILRCTGSATIQTVPLANLRERMTRYAAFMTRKRNGEESAVHPSPWLVSAVWARAEWEGIRHLLATSDAPILRADGSIWQQPGFDERTGVLFDPPAGISFPTIRPNVGLEEAKAAAAELLDVVCDFPFEAEEHKAAWLAGLLTPLGRFAFSGPSPLFLIDANVRGAGKGLLAQAIGRIVLGREVPVSSYAHDSSELRKKLTAIAIAGDRMILFDNLEGVFGNDTLDRVLTSTRWKDRLLGRSKEVDLPLIPAWYATGNNVQIAADTMRRIIHIRLDCLSECPEERSGFRNANLLGWIDANRGRLLTAALTILSAYITSDRPVSGLKPFGSFEGWSGLVREAVVWIGLPDPCLTRTKLADMADAAGDALTQLIVAWEGYDPHGDGTVVSDLLHRLYPASRERIAEDDASRAMRLALENVVGARPGNAPTARQVGNKLRRFRRRVVKGKYFDVSTAEYNRSGTVWKLSGGEHPEPRVCESESVS